MKKPVLIHPFLFGIFPVFFLYAQNIEQLSFSETLLPTIIVICFTILLFVMSKWVFKDYQKAGLLVSISLVLFFSYGHIWDVIQGLPRIGFILGRKRYILLSYGILFVCSIYLTLRKKKNLNNVTNFLNIVSVSLVLISLLNIGTYKIKTRNLLHEKGSLGARELTKVDSVQTEVLHDIYYIILDGYAGSSTLKEVYKYNNQEFVNYLIEKGFFLASKSRSNYATTFLSLASSLNMEYVNYLTDLARGESQDWRAAYQMIKDNKVVNFLKSKGYKYVHINSGWGPTDYNKYADLNIQCGRINEFLMIIIQTTILKAFEDFIIGDDSRARILCTFSRLSELNKMKEPKFVFAHILSPHPPYVFGANGEPTPKAIYQMDRNVWELKEDYLNQLSFINKKVQTLIDTILLRSEVPPIIVLQADHGSASTWWNTGSSGWDEHPTELMLRERMGIFNAYYLPPGGNSLIFDSITPVNTFRLIFNIYFNMQFTLLSDKNYFSIYSNPYEFVDVTYIFNND